MEVKLRLKLGGRDGLDRASRQCLGESEGGGKEVKTGDGAEEGGGRGRTGVPVPGLESLQVGDGTDSELANSTVLRITVYGI